VIVQVLRMEIKGTEGELGEQTQHQQRGDTDSIITRRRCLQVEAWEYDLEQEGRWANDQAGTQNREKLNRHRRRSGLCGHLQAFFKSQTKAFAFPFASLSGIQEGEGTLEGRVDSTEVRSTTA